MKRKQTRAFALKCASLGAAVMLLLGGCSYGQTGLEGLLKPPKLSGEQNDIYNALLTNVTGSDIRLQYPRTGEYTSAFVLQNMDGEPTDEAIVFYASSSDSSMRLNLLDQEDGVWVSKYDTPCPRSASEIEKVGFIQAHTRTFLLVGYILAGEEGQSIRIYDYEDGRLAEHAPISCTNFEVFDLNEDGEDELITITQRIPMGEDAAPTVLAECGVFSNLGQYEMLGSAEMDPDVAQYANIQQGVLTDGRAALYLDGERSDGRWSTEILAYDEWGLRNFIYSRDPEQNLIPQTIRDNGIASYDRGGNGWVSIPIRTPVPGAEEIEPDHREYFTTWYIYDVSEQQLMERDTTYASYSLGYIFTLPEEWQGTVTAEYSTSDAEVNFYAYNAESEEPIGDELLSIKLVARNEYEREVEINGYNLLRDKGQAVYLYRLYPTNSQLGITDLDVQANFQFYNN